MGVATVEPMPTPVPLQDPTLLADNTVLVLLGDDKAGKTLAQMAEPVTADTTAAGETTTTGARKSLEAASLRRARCTTAARSSPAPCRSHRPG